MLVFMNYSQVNQSLRHNNYELCNILLNTYVQDRNVTPGVEVYMGIVELARLTICAICKGLASWLSEHSE